jgi:hypothetical protein
MHRFNQEIPEPPLTPPAQDRANQYIDDFTDALISDAIFRAKRESAENVLSRHVDEAHELLAKRDQKSNRLKQFLFGVGCTLLGAGVQGFIMTLSDDNKILVAVFAVLMVLGTLLACWGAFKE